MGMAEPRRHRDTEEDGHRDSAVHVTAGPAPRMRQIDFVWRQRERQRGLPRELQKRDALPRRSAARYWFVSQYRQTPSRPASSSKHPGSRLAGRTRPGRGNFEGKPGQVSRRDAVLPPFWCHFRIPRSAFDVLRIFLADVRREQYPARSSGSSRGGTTARVGEW